MKDLPVPRRTAMMLAAVPVLAAGTACAAAPPATASRTRNVRDFGAKGDGVTDDTEAFNRATQADAEWSWDLLCSIIVPAGRYRVSGTVFLRKGQSLIGEGLSTYIDAAGAKRSTFIMGRQRGKERGTEDPGGLPVRVERLMGLGGAPDQGFIYATIPGFQINALFLTAVGLGLEIEAADGIVSDVEIDQCLTAVLIRNSQNVVLSNLNFYLANYGINFAGNTRDITVVNSTFCYTQYATILLGDGTKGNTAISITGCVFTNNVPYETFEGYIYSRASHSDLLITGCIFRNAPSYAIAQGAGVDLSLSVQGCIFDGQRTNPDYNQSLKPKAIRTGQGRYTITNCAFRHLSEVVRISPSLASLNIDGGAIEGDVESTIVVEGEPAGPIVIRNLQGFARQQAVGTEHHVRLPWLGSLTKWHVTANSRDPASPAAAAQLVIAAGQTDVLAQTVWAMGPKMEIAASKVITTSAAGTQEARYFLIRLSGRQFGTVAPSIDATGFA